MENDVKAKRLKDEMSATHSQQMHEMRFDIEATVASSLSQLDIEANIHKSLEPVTVELGRLSESVEDYQSRIVGLELKCIAEVNVDAERIVQLSPVAVDFLITQALYEEHIEWDIIKLLLQAKEELPIEPQFVCVAGGHAPTPVLEKAHLDLRDVAITRFSLECLTVVPTMDSDKYVNQLHDLVQLGPVHGGCVNLTDCFKEVITVNESVLVEVPPYTFKPKRWRKRPRRRNEFTSSVFRFTFSLMSSRH